MNHWQPTPLCEVLSRSNEIAEVQPDESYKEITVKLWGKGIVLRGIASGTDFNGSRRFLARKGQLILSRIDARNGAIGLVPESLDCSVVSTDFPLFRIDSNRVLPSYFEWLSKTKPFVELCQRASEGTTNRVRLQEDRFLKLQISLPPLAEQRRIVARIEEIAAKINEARRLRQRSEAEAEVLKSRGRGEVFVRCRQEFGARRLEELTTRITKGESPEWQGYTYQESGPLFIRSENVLWGKLDTRNAVRIPDAFHEKLSRSQLRGGDVLINLVGASIGRTCVVPEILGSANINQAVAVITVNVVELSADFLVHFLLSSVAQDVIHGGKVETARPNISLGDLRELKIPTPSVLAQHRIVAELDALQARVDALKNLQARTAAELDALLPSILDKAFKGEPFTRLNA